MRTPNQLTAQETLRSSHVPRYNAPRPPRRNQHTHPAPRLPVLPSRLVRKPKERKERKRTQHRPRPCRLQPDRAVPVQAPHRLGHLVHVRVVEVRVRPADPRVHLRPAEVEPHAVRRDGHRAEQLDDGERHEAEVARGGEGGVRAGGEVLREGGAAAEEGAEGEDWWRVEVSMWCGR